MAGQIWCEHRLQQAVPLLHCTPVPRVQITASMEQQLLAPSLHYQARDDRHRKMPIIQLVLALCPNPLFLTHMQRSSKQHRVWSYWYYLVFVCIQTHTQALLCMWSVFQEFALLCLIKECSGYHHCCVHSELYPGLSHKQHPWSPGPLLIKVFFPTVCSESCLTVRPRQLGE